MARAASAFALAAFGFGFLSSPRVLRAAEPSAADDWFGRDKALHFGVSVALASGGYAASSAVLDPHVERAICGGALSLGLGTSKELWDLAGHGDPSWRDFTWDVVGTAIGLGLAAGIDALLDKDDEARPAMRGQGLLIRF